jgi:hypothetical protein
MAKTLTPKQLRENVDAIRQQGGTEDDVNEYLASEKLDIYSPIADFIKSAPIKAKEFAKEQGLPMAGDIGGEALGRLGGGAAGLAVGGPIGAAIGQEAGGALMSGAGAAAGRYATDVMKGGYTKDEMASRAAKEGIVSGGTNVALSGALKGGEFLAKELGQFSKVAKVVDKVKALGKSAERALSGVPATEKAIRLDKEAIQEAKRDIASQSDAAYKLSDQASYLKNEAAIKNSENKQLQSAVNQAEAYLQRVKNKGLISESISNKATKIYQDAVDSVVKNPKYKEYGPHFQDVYKMDALLDETNRLARNVAEQSSESTKKARNIFKQDYNEFFKRTTGQSVNVNDELNGLLNLVDEASTEQLGKKIESAGSVVQNNNAKDIISRKKEMIDYGIPESSVNAVLQKELVSSGFSPEQAMGILNRDIQEIPIEDAHKLKQAVQGVAGQVYRSASSIDKGSVGEGLKSISESLVKKIDAADGSTGIYPQLNKNWRDLLDVEALSQIHMGQYGVGQMRDIRAGSGELAKSIINNSKNPIADLDEIASGKIAALTSQINLMKNSNNQTLVDAGKKLEDNFLKLQNNIESQNSIKLNLKVIAQHADDASKKEIMGLEKEISSLLANKSGIEQGIRTQKQEVRGVEQAMQGKQSQIAQAKEQAAAIERKIDRYQNVLPERVRSDVWADRAVKMAVADTMPISPARSAFRAYAQLSFLEKAANVSLGKAGVFYTDVIDKQMKKIIDKELAKKITQRESKVFNVARALIDRKLSSDNEPVNDGMNEDDYVRMTYE